MSALQPSCQALFLDEGEEVQVDAEGYEGFDEPGLGNDVVQGFAGGEYLVVFVAVAEHFVLAHVNSHHEIEEVHEAERGAYVEVLEQIAAAKADIDPKVVGKLRSNLRKSTVALLSVSVSGCLLKYLDMSHSITEAPVM